MKFLISYLSEHQGKVIYGYSIADDPIKWVVDMEKYPEIYILLNAQPMTDDQAAKHNGSLKGM